MSDIWPSTNALSVYNALILRGFPFAYSRATLRAFMAERDYPMTDEAIDEGVAFLQTRGLVIEVDGVLNAVHKDGLGRPARLRRAAGGHDLKVG
jgi:hypothetical protein